MLRLYLSSFLLHYLCKITYIAAAENDIHANNSMFMNSTKEDELIYMRVDDMIFMRPEYKVKAGLSPEKFRWPDCTILYVIQGGLDDDRHGRLTEAMELIESHTRLQFVPFEEEKDEKNYLYISHTDKGCYAHVGFMNRGRQNLNLGKGCWKFGTVIHELIHSIGFSHEHQRNDRDKYVTILYDNMKPDKQHNFKLDKEMGMEFDYFGLPYNYASIMHYGKKAFSKDGIRDTIMPKKVWEDSSSSSESSSSESSDEESYEEDSASGDAIYGQLDENGVPAIGLNKLTLSDIKMLNRMYDDDFC